MKRSKVQNKVEINLNAGVHKVREGSTCAHCSKPFTPDVEIVCHTWQTSAMPAPAFVYYHVPCYRQQSIAHPTECPALPGEEKPGDSPALKRFTYDFEMDSFVAVEADDVDPETLEQAANEKFKELVESGKFDIRFRGKAHRETPGDYLPNE